MAITDPKDVRGGSVATGLDFWAASTLRQAGLRRVLPQASEPFYSGGVAAETRLLFSRVDEQLGSLRDIGSRIADAGLEAQARQLERAVSSSVANLKRIRRAVDRTTASVLGESRKKQVDVFVADWDRGLELLISTKTFALAARPGDLVKNLPNRWEEFDGDLKNLRGRFPLAVIGALTLLPATALEGTLQAFVDMMLKLTAPGRPWVNAYDSAAIVVADWNGATRERVPILNASLGSSELPRVLQPEQFFNELLQRLLQRAPVSEHLDARVAQSEARGEDPGPIRSAAAASSRVQEAPQTYEPQIEEQS